jgi:hypothetical protein
MPDHDEITLTLPRERDFHRVAHLVLGGLAVRLDLTIETLEDLQLALSAILEHGEHDGDVTVSMTVRQGALETSIGPIEIDGELVSADDDGLNLRRILTALVDDVHVDGDYVRLMKRVE